jgi:hypothetical protein
MPACRLEHLVVGDDFTPDRPACCDARTSRRSFVEGRVSRRPKSTWLRRWSLQGNIDYITNNDRELESHVDQANMQFEMTNGDEFELQGERSREVIDEAFDLTDGREVIGVGAYRFGDAARRAIGSARATSVTGDIGRSARDRSTGGPSARPSYRGRLDVDPAFLALEPNLAFNRIERPLAGATRSRSTSPALRTTWTVHASCGRPAPCCSPATGATAAPSAPAHGCGGSIGPGSEIFVVYSEGRDTALRGTPLLNRTFAVKMTRLLRF